MAKLYIREYASMAQVQASKADLAAPQEPPTADQAPITLSGASQQSAAFNVDTRFVAITADGIFSYLVGADPTVTADMLRVTAGQIIFVGVKPGHRVAVITNT